MLTQGRVALCIILGSFSGVDVAKRLGVTRQLVSKIATGEGLPSLALAIKMASVLGIAVEKWGGT